MPKSNGKLTVDPRMDKRVVALLAARRRKDEINARCDMELAPVKQLEQEIIGEILQFMKETGQKSAKTAYGTVTVSVKSTAKLEDPDIFMELVMKKGLYELLDRRANAKACLDYAEEHEGILPPGVRINSIQTVGVTKS